MAYLRDCDDFRFSILEDGMHHGNLDRNVRRSTTQSLLAGAGGLDGFGFAKLLAVTTTEIGTRLVKVVDEPRGKMTAAEHVHVVYGIFARSPVYGAAKATIGPRHSTTCFFAVIASMALFRCE